MSRETSQWLNTMTLIGDTDVRGNAWHYRADLQSPDGGNHFPGAVPPERVKRLMDPAEPVSSPIFVPLKCTLDESMAGHGYVDDSGQPWRFVQVDNRQAVLTQEEIVKANGKVKAQGVFTQDDYEIHSFGLWLQDNLYSLLDGDVHISSAGLLEEGAVAWVELTIQAQHSVADFAYIPHILAFTSTNGRYRTTYKRSVQAVVCDNTLSVASTEKTPEIKIKHTKHSMTKIADAREALGLIVATADEFDQQVRALTEWTVTDKEWQAFLDAAMPLSDDMSKIARTKMEAKRATYEDLYSHDLRVAPWRGTAFGVLQADNTFRHHKTATRGDTNRGQRNMTHALSGKTDESDAGVLALLSTVTQHSHGDVKVPVAAVTGRN